MFGMDAVCCRDVVKRRLFVLAERKLPAVDLIPCCAVVRVASSWWKFVRGWGLGSWRMPWVALCGRMTLQKFLIIAGRYSHILAGIILGKKCLKPEQV